MTIRNHLARPLFSLLESVTLTEADGRVTVCGPWGDVDVADRSPLVRMALHRMSLGPVALYNIPPLFEEFARWRATGEHGTHWLRLKRTLDALGGCVVPSIGSPDGTGPVLSLVAEVSDAVFRCRCLPDDTPIEVRKGTTMEDAGPNHVLLCRGLAYRAILHRSPVPDVIKLLLMGRRTIADVADELRVDRPMVRDVVGYLAAADFVTSSAVNS